MEEENKARSEEIIAIYSLLGTELTPPKLAPSVQAKRDSLLAIAKSNYKQDSNQVENIIWYGRRLSYLSKYIEAINIYSKGLTIFPGSYRLLRHRGHRYISIRKFDLAVADLEAATRIVADKRIEIEADGLPNKINKPLSNTHFNIWYHLGLAYYLKGELKEAARCYETCLQYAVNDDLLCATVDWLFMTYRELGDNEKARKVLLLVTKDMTIIENDAYYKRILMYKGILDPQALWLVSEVENINGDENDRSLALVTQGYGLGNWYRLNGDSERALEIFNDVVKGDSWFAFGYIAAEVILAGRKE